MRHEANPASVGDKFGKLTVVGLLGVVGRRSRVDCLCECGNRKVVALTHIKSGHTTSCGCWQRNACVTHGNTSHGKTSRAYRAWTNMKSRCSNPKAPEFHNYGGRGIRVCERWMTFENFLEDVGEPGAGLSLDRIDNDRGYEPGNTRWATPTQQTRNSRRTVLTAETVRTVRALRADGESVRSIAERFSMSQPNVSSIVNGRSWRDV